MKARLAVPGLSFVSSMVLASAMPVPQTPEEAVAGSNVLSRDLAVFAEHGFTTSCEGNRFQYAVHPSRNVHADYTELCTAKGVLDTEEKAYVIVHEINHVHSLNGYLPGSYYVYDLEDVWGNEPELALFQDPGTATSVEAIFGLTSPRG